MKQKIGIIGFGNMGSVIAEAIKSKYTVYVFDKDKTKTNNLQKINIAETLADLAEKADVVILAVKPQDFDALLAEIKHYIDKKLVISIAAGIRTRYIEKFLGDARIMRAMPNMPASIGCGITALTKGHFADNADLQSAKRIFESLGPTVVIVQEGLMDAVTAVSGSGPAYIFVIFDAILKAAEELGLDKKTASLLIYHSATGAMNLLKKNKFDALSLISKVASKGGTTEAALKVFDDRSLDKIIRNAIVAAYKRGIELSR